MFKRVLIHELKNIQRDIMYKFFMIFPIIIAVVAYFLVPYLKENSGELAANIVTLMFIIVNGFMFGAITGFTLLDDQDDNVLLSLKITPISVKSYVLIKLSISYFFGMIATLLLILVTGFLKDISFLNLMMILLLSPMQGPIIALFINSFAKNKVEGFVFMKLSGMLLMIPVASIFLTNWTEIFLGVIPGFWTARIVSMHLIPGDYLLGSTLAYFSIGIIVHFLIGYLFFRLYQKRVNI
jgi:fluoroquinolone transport system permease protein